MYTIPRPVTEQSIRKALSIWINLLADEKYAQAAEFLLEEGECKWTAELLREVISNHQISNDQVSPSQVTRENETKGGLLPRHDIIWDGFAGEAWYDMPLLGEWSDLTAVFAIKSSLAGAHLILEQLRVK